MKRVYSSSGFEIGKFNGTFVHGPCGERLYWVDDGDVFSPTRVKTESHFSRPVNVRVGSFENGIAKAEDGTVIFAFNIVA